PSAPFEKKEVCAMVPVDRQQRDAVDRLVEEYTQRGLSRRELLRRGVALGLSASIAGAILDACGASSSGGGANVKSTDLVTSWGGTEQDSFRAVVAPFTQDTGVTVSIEATRDLDAVLTARVRGNNAPGIAILPNPAKMVQLAKQNKLIALDSFLDM